MTRRSLAPAFLFLILAACVPVPDNAVTENGTTTIELPSDTGTEQMMIEDGDPANDDDDMIEDTSVMDDSSAMRGGSRAAVQPAVYADYTPGVLTDGEIKVLYFHAAWCPICRQGDAMIRDVYSRSTPMFSVYKVDYDTETALKSRYGVTYQHTFVLVDGQGNAVQTLQGADETELRALIGA